MALQSPINETLTRIGIKYMQDPSQYQASKIFPTCPVNLLASNFPTYDKAYWLKNEAEIRAPGTESHGGTHARGLDTYSCRNIAYHEDVPEENIANDPEPLNPERAATMRVIGKIALYDEVYFSTNYFKSGVWADGTDKNAAWATPSTATPMVDIANGRQAVKLLTGFDPNVLVLDRKSYDALKFCDEIVDRIKYTSSQVVTPDLLARLFEIDRVIVLNAIYDSAKFGATAAHSFIASNGALLLHVTDMPSLEMPSAGYNFTWNGYGVGGFGVRRFYLEKERAWRVEANSYHDMKMVASDLGYFIKDTVTAT